MYQQAENGSQMIKYKVYCRLRPNVRGTTGRERAITHSITTNELNTKHVLSFQNRPKPVENQRIVRKSDTPHIVKRLENHDYQYDQVFGMEASQCTVFEQVGEPMINEFMNGINTTIFAYGQTGTGKTHTIHGASNNEGLLPRSFKYIFNELSAEPRDQYEITVKYIELYKERMYDLLSDMKYGNRKPKISFHLDKDGKKEITVHSVKNHQEAVAILKNGCQKRRTAKTIQNAHSSRSHSICSIYLTKKCQDNTTICSVLNLVDLAGSEQYYQINKGTAKWNPEAQQINLSLFHLKSLLTTLSKRKHVAGERFSFRNSLLTTFLKDSLSGNGVCAMIATVALDDENIDQTINTCRFSGTVAKIRNNVSQNLIIGNQSEKMNILDEEFEKFCDIKAQLNEAIEANKVLRTELNNTKAELEKTKSRIYNMEEAQKEEQKEAYGGNSKSMCGQFEVLKPQFCDIKAQLNEAIEANKVLRTELNNTKAELENTKSRIYNIEEAQRDEQKEAHGGSSKSMCGQFEVLKPQGYGDSKIMDERTGVVLEYRKKINRLEGENNSLNERLGYKNFEIEKLQKSQELKNEKLEHLRERQKDLFRQIMTDPKKRDRYKQFVFGSEKGIGDKLADRVTDEPLESCHYKKEEENDIFYDCLDHEPLAKNTDGLEKHFWKKSKDLLLDSLNNAIEKKAPLKSFVTSAVQNVAKKFYSFYDPVCQGPETLKDPTLIIIGGKDNDVVYAV